METYDKSKTGTLNRDEVREMCKGIVADVCPLAEVLESDVDSIMRVAGDRANEVVTIQEIPDALSVILALKSESIFNHELFVKWDTDKTGTLNKNQLAGFVTEITEGVIPDESDLDYMIQQCDVSGDGAIEEAQIKAAMMAWYCLSEQETPLPKTVEEAKQAGYNDEQIAVFLKTSEPLMVVKEDEPLIAAKKDVEAETTAEVASTPTESTPTDADASAVVANTPPVDTAVDTSADTSVVVSVADAGGVETTTETEAEK